MKHLRLSMSLLAGLMILFFSSCDKEKEASPLSVDLSKKATIKGYVFAELDMTSAGMEKAPAGTKILVTVDYSYLNSSVNGSWKDTTMVDNNGQFSVQVPADDNGVNAEIYAIPFEYNQVQEYGSYFNQLMKVYEAGNKNVSLSSNETKIIQITYSGNTLDNFVDMVEISGNLTAELNDTVVGREDTDGGIQLAFHADGWSKSVTTGDEGSFTVVVPKSETIYVDFSFQRDRITWDAEEGEYMPMPYLFEAKNKSLGTFPGSEDDVIIDAGEGELIEE